MSVRYGDRSKRELPRRKNLRFSIRSLMLFVIAAAAALGWMVNEARVQFSAVQVIQRRGGTAMYGWEFKRGAPDPQARPWAPRWLVRRVGVDYFGSVVFVNIRDVPIGDEAVTAAIGRLGRLERLELRHSQLTEAQLANVRNLTRLRRLDLSFCTVEDRALVHLGSLRRLESLDLNSTWIGDVGLSYLKDLIGLRSLCLDSTQVSDDGLAFLGNLQALTSLSLYNTRVTDAGLARLTSLSNLRELSLGETIVSDAGLTYLARLPNLGTVWFTSDRTIGSEKVTREGLRELQQARPKLIIK